jgi:Cu/Ag efflux protein CusF
MEEGMAMPFLVASLDVFDGFRPGDRITFDLHSVPDALLVVHIERRP